MALFWLFFLGATSLLMLILGVFVLFQGKPKNHAILTFLFSIFTFFYVFFAALRDFFISSANNLLLTTPTPDPILCAYLTKIHSVGLISLIGGALLMPSLVHFFLSFPIRFSKYDSYIVIVCYTLSLFFSVSFVTSAYPFGAYFIGVYHPDLNLIKMQLPSTFSMYALYISLSIFGSIALVIHKIKHLTGTHHSIMKWIGWWFIFAMLMIEIFSLVLPSLGLWHVSKYGRASMFLLLAGMFVAVTSYRAFQIKTAIHYTIYWSLVSVAILIPFLCLLKWFYPILTRVLSNPLTFLELCCIAGLSSLIALIYVRWVQSKLNQLFFRRKFQLNDQAIAFLETISTLHDTQDLIQHVQHTFKTILYASDVRILLHDTVDPPQDNITVISLRVAHFYVGELWIYEKKNLKPYSSDELKFMKRVSHQIAVMLNNARLLEQVLQTEREKVEIEQKQTHTQEIARGIIHEVKNTHFAISNFVSMILNQQTTDPAFIDSILKTIGEQSLKLHLFSKNYLHQELIKSKLYALSISNVQIHTLIRDALKSNYFFILLHNLKVDYDSIPLNLTLPVDRDKFHLVISNIVNNAALYQNSNCLTITLESSDDAIDLYFSSPISSQNPGKPHGLSTGIGLHISQHIVTYHKGTLSIFENQTTFVICIRLPLST